MKILLRYLKPHKWLVALVLLLAAINISFSLIDPIIFGKLIDLGYKYHDNSAAYQPFWWGFAGPLLTLLGASIGVAMISRIAKAFQDYFLNVVTQKFGATVFTEGLQHAMGLPYQEFEDQRSGETLGILLKVRIDTEKFVASFVNVLFPVVIGILFVAIFAFQIHPLLPLIYFGGIFLLTIISNLLSKKIKTVQKVIVKETTSLAGSTTESLRNLIKTIEKQKANREAKLKELSAEKKKDDGLVFDELGVDHIFIDEAHYFKNLETPTKMERVAGIQTGGSQRAFDQELRDEEE